MLCLDGCQAIPPLEVTGLEPFAAVIEVEVDEAAGVLAGQGHAVAEDTAVAQLVLEHPQAPDP